MGFGKLLSWEAACREMKGLVWGSYWVILAPVTLHPQVWVFLATLDLSGHGLRRSPQHAGGPWLPSLAHVPVPVAFADHSRQMWSGSASSVFCIFVPFTTEATSWNLCMSYCLCMSYTHARAHACTRAPSCHSAIPLAQYTQTLSTTGDELCDSHWLRT